MSKSLTAINIIFAVTDTLISALAIVCFGWGAWFFNRWWVLAFTIIPLALFHQHSLVIDADLDAAKEANND